MSRFRYRHLTWVLLALFSLGTACTKAAEPGHDGHDHGKEGHADEGHDGHGEAHALGEVTLAGARLAITAHGEIEAGHEAVLTVTLAEGTAPAALRAWVGIESGKGSVKGLLGKVEKGWHGHFEAPATLPDGSAVWIEADAEDGATARASVAIPAEEHQHGEKPATEPKQEQGNDHKH